jgi:hypothetical protein
MQLDHSSKALKVPLALLAPLPKVLTIPIDSIQGWEDIIKGMSLSLQVKYLILTGSKFFQGKSIDFSISSSPLPFRQKSLY